MGLFSIFRRKNPPPSQEERELGGETMAIKAKFRRERMQLEHDLEMLRLEQQKLLVQSKIAELQDNTEEDFSIDGMIQKLIMSAVMQKYMPQSAAPATMDVPQNGYLHAGQDPAIDFSQIWERIPAEKKPLIKTLTDDQIRGFIHANYPQIPPATVDKAILFVRSQ